MSKTVKRVSETVKRVMRVMMVGLIAMLGVETEAHWYSIGGIPKRCSHCVDAHLEKGRDIPDNPPPHSEEADFHLETIKVEYLCPTASGGISTELSLTPVKLVVQKLIVPVPGDVTYESVTDSVGTRIPFRPDPVISARLDLEAKFSDFGLKEHLHCPGGQPPLDVLIRETSFKIFTYWCDFSNPRKCTQLSAFDKPMCRLPNRYNFNNYPPIGVPYVCP